jgi:hypothetical protein
METSERNNIVTIINYSHVGRSITLHVQFTNELRSSVDIAILIKLKSSQIWLDFIRSVYVFTPDRGFTLSVLSNDVLRPQEWTRSSRLMLRIW